MSPADWSNITYTYLLITTTIGVVIWRAFKHAVKTVVAVNTDEICKRLDRIDYALYNDGKTGLINKVDSLIDNQQKIKIDVEVLKAKYEG